MVESDFSGLTPPPQVDTEFLLPAQANDTSVLAFRLGDYALGINVAHVCQVLPRGPVAGTAGVDDAVLGEITLNGAVVPVVSLRRLLHMPESSARHEQTLVLITLHQRSIALAVDQIIPTREPPVLRLLDVEKIYARLAARATLAHWFVPSANKRLLAELAPPWPLDEDDAPAETNPRVWQTLRVELADRARHLRKLLEAQRAAPGHDSLAGEVLLTLRTIKAAARVGSVWEIVHATERLETLLSSSPDNAPALEAYIAWLLEVSSS